MRHGGAPCLSWPTNCLSTLYSEITGSARRGWASDRHSPSYPETGCPPPTTPPLPEEWASEVFSPLERKLSLPWSLSPVPFPTGGGPGRRFSPPLLLSLLTVHSLRSQWFPPYHLDRGRYELKRNQVPFSWNFFKVETSPWPDTGVYFQPRGLGKDTSSCQTGTRPALHKKRLTSCYPSWEHTFSNDKNWTNSKLMNNVFCPIFPNSLPVFVKVYLYDSHFCTKHWISQSFFSLCSMHIPVY